MECAGTKKWKQKAQERKQWKEIIEQAKTHKSCRAEEEEEECSTRVITNNKMVTDMAVRDHLPCSTHGAIYLERDTIYRLAMTFLMQNFFKLFQVP
jgi:hypothetical protein